MIATAARPGVVQRATVAAQGAWRVWRRDATVYRHLAKWLLIPNFLDPFMFLVALGLGLGGYVAHIEGVTYIDFIAPGLVASSVMYTASFECTWNVTWKLDTAYTYVAMAATPLEAGDIAVGEILWGGTRAALTGVIFFVVLILFGLVHSAWGLAMPLVAVLIGTAFAAMGILAASYITHMAFWGYYYTLVVTPMFLLSGTFFPVDRFPAWAKTLAWFTPLYNGTAVLRDLSFGKVGLVTLGHLAVLALTPVVLVPPAIRKLRARIMT